MRTIDTDWSPIQSQTNYFQVYRTIPMSFGEMKVS